MLYTYLCIISCNLIINHLIMSFNGENPVITGIEIRFHWFKWEIDPSLSHKYFSNALTLNLNIIVIKLLYNNRIMIVEPMVQRGLPRKDSINPLSKKQNLGILTFYNVRLFKRSIEISSRKKSKKKKKSIA